MLAKEQPGSEFNAHCVAAFELGGTFLAGENDMKVPLILVSMIGLSACGTVTTLSGSDQKISSNLSRAESYCESVPRVYSGVAYDVCKLNSRPSGTAVDLVVGFYLLDGLLSAATDTLVLPYTIIQQSQKGNIQIAD